MKRTTAALILVSLWVCGCSSSENGKRVEQGSAFNLLGPNAVYVLSDPTRVEGWNFQRPDGSIATDPQIRKLPLSVGRDVAKVLLAAGTYKEPARGGGFERAVGYRFWRADQSAEFYLSFANDQLYIKALGPGGQPNFTSVGFTAAHDRLLDVSRKAFPDYRPPAGAKAKRR